MPFEFEDLDLELTALALSDDGWVHAIARKVLAFADNDVDSITLHERCSGSRSKAYGAEDIDQREHVDIFKYGTRNLGDCCCACC